MILALENIVFIMLFLIKSENLLLVEAAGEITYKVAISWPTVKVVK